MARKGLRSPLRAALRHAVAAGQAVETRGVVVTTAEGTTQRLTLAVEPRREAGSDMLYLIVFVETAPSGGAAPGTGEATADTGPTGHLEAELRDTREQLQSITEEHDTALEELRSANEELHSVNEELQSTNEEFETSKEEIQSINEELQTANGQLASKVDELDRRNSDLKNLFDSTHVATIFLDQYLVIRSFTPAVASIYNLIPSDQGRPLTDIVSRLRYAGLREGLPARAADAGAAGAARAARRRHDALPDAGAAIPHAGQRGGRHDHHVRGRDQHRSGRAAPAPAGRRAEPPRQEHADRRDRDGDPDDAPLGQHGGVSPKITWAACTRWRRPTRC